MTKTEMRVHAPVCGYVFYSDKPKLVRFSNDLLLWFEVAAYSAPVYCMGGILKQCRIGQNIRL